MMMKKVLIVLLAGGFFASCNNAADNTQREKDSLDSIAREKKGRDRLYHAGEER